MMNKYLFSYATESDPPLKRGIIRLVEKATGQPKLKAGDPNLDALLELHAMIGRASTRLSPR